MVIVQLCEPSFSTFIFHFILPIINRKHSILQRDKQHAGREDAVRASTLIRCFTAISSKQWSSTAEDTASTQFARPEHGKREESNIGLSIATEKTITCTGK